MLEAPLPTDEAARLATLVNLQILDTPPDPRFDRITRFAARLFDVPVSLISLIDAERQWFKSCHGLDISETPRAFSFCAHAVLSHEVMVVPDTLLDERFADNPYVAGPPFIRFYAGCPLSALDGSRLGTLCIVDYRPRQMSEDDLQSLRDVALWAQHEIVGSELSRAYLLLRESQAQMEAFLDNTSDLIQGVTQEGRFIYVNRAWRNTLGYDNNDLARLTIFDIIQPSERQHFITAFQRALTDEQDHALEAPFMAKDGRCVILSSKAVRYCKNSRIRSVGGIFRDITEQRQAEAALRQTHSDLQTREHQALHDPLTGLPNRALLYNCLQQAINIGRREDKPFALLLVDLDRFKEVNDTHGHHKGDLLLRQLGPRLRNALRDSDTLARLGGDEFAVVLPHAGAAEAALVAQKILDALEEPVVIEGLSLEIGASIGIALYPEHGAETDLLMQRADVAMYAAKRGGGYAVYAALYDHRNVHRLEFIGDMRQAIEREQLVLHYQPKVSITTGEVASVEALVRWRHPQHGLIEPDQFIPIAERTGLINRLALWVLDAALRQGRAWHQAGLPIGIAVNLSLQNLQNRQLPDQIMQLLQATSFAPHYLELEITENVMSDPAPVMDMLMRLSELDVRLSVDGFGTGYSSLSYLRKPPVDAIKIGQSFVIGMATNEDDALIVRQIIDLAHAFGIKVVGEGVETREVLDKLAGLNCDFAQGYYIGGPLPAADLTDWLLQRQESIN